ncbi:group II intron reverse transcriptase/maturase [Bengtsoniella intestinalis]|uniref:group II intron reverse transcriptase/maturase n=1 Tax=Bengtsoniella intestinalis TaxID=3073143 RepID=UPI00391F49A1
MTTTDTKHKKKQTLRNNEYYNTQQVFDDLYANAQKGKTFSDLLPLILSEQNIQLAYRNIKQNKGSRTKGVNGHTIAHIGNLSPQELTHYVNGRLNDFHPHAVRRVEIEKDNGKKRPLGIPTIEDRLIQQCIKQVLEPICEAKFHKHSYGFRPNRSTHHAIARVMFLMNVAKLPYAVDIDIRGFFDNVDHAKLMKQLWSMGIRDKTLLCILGKMLKTEIQGIGIPQKGIPQGGILSPLLANVVLNELDWWISSQWETHPTRKSFTQTSHKFQALKKTGLKEVFIVRYADDFKLMCRTRSEADKLFHATKQWLWERLKLEISEEKSKVVNLKRCYSDFLGIKIKLHKKGEKWVTKSQMRDKAVTKCTNTMRDAIKELQYSQGLQTIWNYNAIVLGMHNYYGCATEVSRNFADIAYNLKKCLYNRTQKIATSKGTKTKVFLRYYGRYGGKVIFVRKIALFPISHIRTRPPLGFNQRKCDYTPEGRAFIHENLTTIDLTMLRYFMTYPTQDSGTQWHDNRLSLYVGQRGMCGVTGELLQIGNVEIHHKKPKHLGGTDEYKNLIMVTEQVHKLIHATTLETIAKYLIRLNLDKQSLEKLNKLRVLVGNCELNS